MPTVAGGTIGTGGTYASIAAWWAACPADLVAADQIWQGRLLNQEFTFAATAVTISGKTTDATRYIELTTETGCSFLDHADKATNPLRYDATKGAAIRFTAEAFGIIIQQRWTRFNKIQVSSPSNSNNAAIVINGATGTDCTIDRCIVESYGNNSGLRGAVSLDGLNNTISNSVVVQRRADASAAILRMISGAKAYNCTLVATGGVPLTAGIHAMYVGPVLKNVYMGGVAAPDDGVVAATKTNCYTNATATGWSTAPFSTANFANVTDGTHDLRKVAGSVLIDAGAVVAESGSFDVLGYGRTNGAAMDVGADEYQGGGAQQNASGTAGWTDLPDVIAATANVPLPKLVTPALKNNAGSLLANEVGATALIYSVATGALVVTKTGQATSAAGVMTITDAALVVGTQYRIVLVLASGAEGMDKLSASA